MAKRLVPRITTGVPDTVKPRPRADMRVEEFQKLIDNKGYRVWWSRTSICPCRNNEDTDQADVACPLCGGDGWFEHLPDEGLEDHETDAYGNPVELNDALNAVQVHAWLSSATRDPQIFERFGEWAFGMAKCSMDGNNKLGHRDKLEVIDAVMTWNQLLKADGTATIPVTGGRGAASGLQYRAVDVHLLRSLTTVYRLGRDYKLVEDSGAIQWLITPPVEDTMLTVNYLVHPIFRVMDHVYAFRDTNVQKRNKATTEEEEHTYLPTQVLLKLEFMGER